MKTKTQEHIESQLAAAINVHATEFSILASKLRKAARVSDHATFEEVLEAKQRVFDALHEITMMTGKVFNDMTKNFNPLSTENAA